MPLDGFDFNNPDYAAVFRQRVEALTRIRQNPDCIPALKAYYKLNPADFINDWGTTYDPRNVERGLPAVIPFILFPKQREWIEFVLKCWQDQQAGLTEKSRDCGVSWLSISLGCTLCLHYHGMAIGYGSRKEEYVDKLGSPKSLFFKARMFMENIPVEFKGEWDSKLHAPHLRIGFPETGSYMSGEAGDGIGRGDRTGIYFVDESAFLDRPQLIEASLSATTNCRQDVSTPHGMNNPFAIKVKSGKYPVFTFNWRDDPRKGEAWYQKQLNDLDEVTIAQEINIDYAASMDGVLIPSAWVQAAVDAHKKLGYDPVGIKRAGLDVADEGKDKCALAGATGTFLDQMEVWSGKGSDIFATTAKSFNFCDQWGASELTYDANGVGSDVKGNSRVLNTSRTNKLIVKPFMASASVINPHAEDVPGRKNEEFFQNLKAQACWSVRKRFERTYRAVVEGAPFVPDDIISISSKIKNLPQLLIELSQPTYGQTTQGRTIIDKAPDGMPSPNMFDAVMILFSGQMKKPMKISSAARNKR